MTFLRGNTSRALSLLLVSGLMLVTGCADDGKTALPGGGTGSGLNAGGATTLYAIQAPSSSSTSILSFSLSASSGSLTPLTTLTPPSGVAFNAVTTDSSGQIYAGAYFTATDQGEVLVYPAGSTGAATPARTITGGTSASTGFAVPVSMHISSAGTLGILSTDGSVYSFATLPATSTGTVTPTTLITSTQISGPSSATIDQNGVVYITNYSGTGVGQILEFAAGSTGNVAPTNTITTPTGTAPYGIAVDASGNVFTVVDSTGSGLGAVSLYSSGATGLATPTRSISGSTTGIVFGGGLRLDSAGNLYLINEEASGTSFDLLGFKSSATGNVAPGLNIASSALTSPDAEIAVR